MVDRNVARLGCDAGQPGLDMRIARQVEVALVRDVRVAIERDVGQAVARAHEEFTRLEMALHYFERGVALLDQVGQIGFLLGRELVEEMPPEAHHGDIGLVAVLLEEHPLQRLGARHPVGRCERRALGEIPEDRPGLREERAILELQRGNAAVGVLLEELGRARLALHDVALDPLVGQAELRQQQAHLVAVARAREIVKRHHRNHSAATATAAALVARYVWMRSAASRPSRTAHTTSEAPRTMSPAANTPSMLVIMWRQSILSVPQPVTSRSGAPIIDGRSSGSKPSAFSTKSASMLMWLLGISCGVWRPDASGMPRWMRTERTWLTLSLPRNPCGADSQTNSTPSSSACFTSRCEPGMLARSRRYRHFTDRAPWRTAVRTQSIAVSPPPITTTCFPAAFSVPCSNSATVSPRPVRLEAVR